MSRPLRLVDNPPNPWASAHVEWLEAPPEAQLEVYEERAKSILAKNDSPDISFTWSLNPYRGCQHACAYCYARPTHEYLGHGAGSDFDSKIVAKVNAPELLRFAFSRRSWKRETIALSGVTDPYQPLEASYRLTGRCLEVARDFENPVGIITKSSLVRRDRDLLAEIEERAGASVFVSIPFADDASARAIEPAAASPTARFETLRLLSEAGIETGVAVSPLIPGLSDEQMPEILERARQAGATRAFTIFLRLVEPVRSIFKKRLHAALPQRAEKILNQWLECKIPQGSRASDFGERFRGAGPRYEAIRTLFEMHCARLGLRSSDAPPRTRRRPRPRQLELFSSEEEGG